MGQSLEVGNYAVLADRLSWVIGAALLLVLPAVSALLVINISFGVMNRAAPQLNIFTIGFLLTLVIGLLIFWVSTSDILAQYHRIASEALFVLRGLAQVQ